MLSNEFINDYKACSDKFYSFKNFFEKFFCQTSPKKIQIQNSVESFLSNQTKDAIIINFFLNKNFSTIERWPSGIINFIIQTFEETESSKNHLARLSLLLHLSKSNLSKQGFIYFLKNLCTIDVISDVERIFPNFSPTEIFEKTKNNNPIFGVISDIVFKITGQQIEVKDLDNVSLTFFKSRYNNLNGYAGIKQIYISIDRTKELITILDQAGASDEHKCIIVKFYLTRLFIHELSHVMVREKFQNFNASSPFSNLKQSQNISIIESGYLAEKKLFCEKIDWHQSAEKWQESFIDYNYLKLFYDTLMQGSKITLNEFEKFDISKAGVLIDSNPPNLMAIDSSNPIFPSFE